MSELKPVALHRIPLNVLLIFRRMFNREIQPCIRSQLLHGVYLAYLCSIYIAWFVIAMFCFDGMFNVDYYGMVCIYFIAISVVSNMLNTKLRKILGLYNPLEACGMEFLAGEISIKNLIKDLADGDGAKIYRPAVHTTSKELADIFFQLADDEAHKLFVARYTEPKTETKILHIVDSTLVHSLHIYFNTETSTIEVF